MDDGVGRSQVETDAAGFEADQEDRYFAGLDFDRRAPCLARLARTDRGAVDFSLNRGWFLVSLLCPKWLQRFPD